MKNRLMVTVRYIGTHFRNNRWKEGGETPYVGIE